MGITGDFLVKHLRPIGTGAVLFNTSAQLREFLTHELHLPDPTVDTLLASWSHTAACDPFSQSHLFVESARLVSTARWSELYTTPRSTIMFLDAMQIARLSEQAELAGPRSNFEFRPASPIAISVTLNHGTGASHIVWGALGFRGATDDAANCVHFEALFGTD